MCVYNMFCVSDFPPSASLTVSPDRVQHFTSDSVSLSCEGNSTEWRVRRFPEDSYLSLCSDWGTMTGSTCNISGLNSSAVYWCESGSGQFTNSVNITGHNGDIILVSPVLPVTEGTSVTLGCKLRRENVVSNVFFYQNDKLIQNDTRVELIISAVLKSDQGFYRCGVQTDSWIRTLTSPQSWMAVKLTSTTENSSFPLSLVVGLVCGILLIFLLLLLCCCRKSKGDARLNESVKGPEDTNNDESRDVTYALIEFKKEKKNEPEESSGYSDVKFGSAAGKSSPAAADESVYSEVKPGAALDQ
ncbi:high affinity immunoglobulin gamma Fc receptor I-like isoform X2 [Anabas testudineus]|uniref:high affinity immunoglobulin gamma Fc receptor I-like isoform X2 n=1 Tax=Anabas testudineus TaxID=64144 RepID=UPI000E465B6B|nr:high affinity immunoglobulin gamma Fc receptor I-like isoform X2 [Anabas testudineus]